MKKLFILSLIPSLLVAFSVSAFAQETMAKKHDSRNGYKNTSTKIHTRVGTFEYKGGYPTEETIEKAFDQLDMQRATQAYLDFMPLASTNALFESHIRDYGITTPGDVGIYVQQGAGKVGAIGLTYNTESIYASANSMLMPC